MNLWRFLRKCLFACLSLLVLVSLTFILLKGLPGDPFQQEQALPEETYNALKEYYGFNDPLWQQYTRYLRQLLSFNFGPSLVYQGLEVSQIIRANFPISAQLGAEALLFAIPLGLCFGILAALKRNRWTDRTTLLCMIAGISIPSFVLAAFLQYLFAIKLGWFPIARWGAWNQSLLPALSLAAVPAAFIAKMTRSLLIVELTQSYVRTAFAKGLPKRIVILRHILRNIAGPLLGYLGPLAAGILTGSFIIEKIYNIPGLGYWFINSVSTRDYPVIMGVTVFYCTLLLLINLAVEMLCIWIDPRKASEA
jgi:oligopeptide transport system permease protein